MSIIRVTIQADNKKATGEDGHIYDVVSNIENLQEKDIYFAFVDEEDNNAELQNKDSPEHGFKY